MGVIPSNLALFSSAFCALLSIRVAFGYLDERRLLFRALALFSLQWAFLIGFYSQPKPFSSATGLLLVSYGGFVMVLAAANIRTDEHEYRKKNPGEYTVGIMDKLSLYLLSGLLTPVGLKFLLITTGPITDLIGWNPAQKIAQLDSKVGDPSNVLGYAILMDSIGYLALARAMKHPIVWAVSMSYMMAEIVFGLPQVVNSPFLQPIAHLGDESSWKVAFAIFKIVAGIS